MNSQKNHIQVIINEIDEVLNQPDTSDSPQALKQTLKKSQKILQQILDYQNRDVDSIPSPEVLSFNLSQENEHPVEPSVSVEQHPQHLEELLAPISQYIQEDLKNLQQERKVLLEEIRQLERRKQQDYSLAKQYAKQQQIISEFSQALLGPVQETLVEQLSQLGNQHPSQIQNSVPSSQSNRSETIKDIESSELMTISVDNLEDDYNFSESFVDESKTEDSKRNVSDKINYTETETEFISSQKKQQIEQLPLADNDFNNRINATVFTDQGDAIFNTINTDNTESSSQELNNQQASSLDESNSEKQQKLEILQSQNTDHTNTDLLLDNLFPSQLKAPSFEENVSEHQDYQNPTPKIEEKIETNSHESPLENSSNFDENENRESAEIESLSHIFGELEINQEESKQLNFPEQVQSHQTNVKQTQPTKEKYIQASVKENLLPVKEQEEPQKEELLLDTNTIDLLRSDLKHLEEIDPDESILDDTAPTKLQLGEYQPLSSAENIPNATENPLMNASEEEFTDITNLEDLFGSIYEDSNTSNPNMEISSEEEQDMENEQTLEDILDSLTLSTDDASKEIEIETETETETDNRDYIDWETLLENPPNQEKKKLINQK
ncbi:MAG: hypothetical protein WBA93_14735 [Microcoleaceae cyanobacterium]